MRPGCYKIFGMGECGLKGEACKAVEPLKALWTPTSKATRKCVSDTLVKGMSTILVGNNTAACKDGNGVETPSGWRYASICRLTKRRAQLDP